jgi:phosphate transport system substrate-binding protein
MRPNRSRLLVMLALLVAAAAAQLPSAAVADGPAMTVSPTTTGLVDGQVVTIDWSGFQPQSFIYIRECAHGATSASRQCVRFGRNPENNLTDATGSGSLRFLLKAADFGKFTCDDRHACDLVAMQQPDDLTGAVRVQVGFAHSPTACPGALAAPVGGEGASSAAYTMYAWENAACNTPSHLSVTYTNDNSFDGLSHWLSGFPGTNFGVTGLPLAADQLAQLRAQHRTFRYAPLTATGVGLAFNLVDKGGNQVSSLVLTAHIIAEIATNRLSSLYCPPDVADADCMRIYGADPDIRRLNPNVDFPAGPVNFFINADHSSSNVAFTSWLSATAPDLWTYGTSSVWPPPDPNACKVCSGGVSGENNVMLNGAVPDPYIPQAAYFTVVDTTYAAIGDLPLARIINPGQPETGVAPTKDSITAAIADAATNDDGTVTPDYATSDPNAYPIPMVSYATVPTSKGWPGFTADDGKTLAAFLRFAVSDAGQSDQVLPPGSYPLPGALKTTTTAAAGQIPTSEPTPTQTGGGGGPTTFGPGSGGGGFGSGTGGGLGGSGGSVTPPGGGAGHGSNSPAPPKLPLMPLAATISSPAGSTMSRALALLALIALLVAPIVWLVREGLSGGRLPTLSGIRWRPGGFGR